MDSVKRLLFTIIMVLFVHTAQAETLNDEGFGAGTLNAGVVSANFTELNVTGNATINGNLTALYLKGNGSLITGLTVYSNYSSFVANETSDISWTKNFTTTQALNSSNLTVLNSTGLGQPYNSNFFLKINQTNSFNSVQTQTLAVWADHTAEANTTAGTAQTLRGSSSVVNASTYFGKTQTYNTIYFDIVTAAAGWANRLMYWNGSAWNTTTITDGTTNLAVDGSITFTPPADWATTTVNGTAGLYWTKLNSTTAVTTNATISLAVPSAIKSVYLNAQPGDTTPAFYIDSNGLVCFNNSVDLTRAIRLGADVDLYRSAANVLAVNDGLTVAGAFSTSANNTITGQVTNSRATPSPVLLLQGLTAANATVPVQSAPLIRWETRAWNTQGAGANVGLFPRMGFIAKTDNYTNVTEMGSLYIETGYNKTGTGMVTGAVYANVSWWNFTTVNTTRFNIIGSQQITGGLDEVQLVVKANTTQTTDLTQWKNQAGAVLTNITPLGVIFSPSITSNYTLISSLSTNLSYSGMTMNLTAGENITACDAVYIKSDGNMWKADANLASAYPAIGLVVANTTNQSQGIILLKGVLKYDAWAWTSGNIIYLNTTAGGLTATQPAATDDVIQIIGIAINATKVYVNPSLDWMTHT